MLSYVVVVAVDSVVESYGMVVVVMMMMIMTVANIVAVAVVVR